MGKGMSKVLENLYIGSFADSNDKTSLDRLNISHIVTAMESSEQSFEDKTYFFVQISDTYAANISEHFLTAVNFIHENRLKKTGVLVHCMAGASRSVTLAVAYLATVTEIPWRDCLTAVRAVRRQANPNLGFQQQLELYEKTSITDVRKQLLEKYGENPFAEEDVKQIRSLIYAFQNESSNPRYANPFYDTLPTSVNLSHLGISPADNNEMKNVTVSPGASAVAFTIDAHKPSKRMPPSVAKKTTNRSSSDDQES